MGRPPSLQHTWSGPGYLENGRAIRLTGCPLETMGTALGGCENASFPYVFFFLFGGVHCMRAKVCLPEAMFVSAQAASNWSSGCSFALSSSTNLLQIQWTIEALILAQVQLKPKTPKEVYPSENEVRSGFSPRNSIQLDEFIDRWTAFFRQNSPGHVRVLEHGLNIARVETCGFRKKIHRNSALIGRRSQG